ncbi:DUF4260 domain-containing protein [Devosia sp. A449]
MSWFVIWQRFEGALVLVGALVLFWQLDSGWAWWLAIPVFFAPDLSFLAYAFGPRVGAVGYNIVHIYGFGLVLLAAGSVFAVPALAACGALFLAHAGFDRMLGYGLKALEGFSLTHLGRIGKGA